MLLRRWCQIRCVPNAGTGFPDSHPGTSTVPQVQHGGPGGLLFAWTCIVWQHDQQEVLQPMDT